MSRPGVGPDRQRLRVSFARGEPIKYITHLDLMRLWERVLRRAEVPLAYSQGFNPRPKLSLAAPLAVGVTSAAELMDLFLWRPVSSYAFIRGVTPQLPQGLEIRAVEEIGLRLPSLQSLLRASEYRVEVKTERSPQEVEAALSRLLASEHIPWERHRDTGSRRFDLRAVVERLWLIGYEEGRCLLGMRLRSDQTMTGRPEEVSAALGFTEPPLSLHRSGLVLAPLPPPPRRRGRRSWAGRHQRR